MTTHRERERVDLLLDEVIRLRAVLENKTDQIEIKTDEDNEVKPIHVSAK